MKKHSGSWVGVMLHHTAGATKDKIKQIQTAHLNRGWGNIGYHYVLEIDDKGHGHLKPGRSLEYAGAHAGVNSYNNSYIGLCVPGNYEVNLMPEQLYQDLLGAICTLMQKNKAYGFCGHREVKATDCPGKNINLNRMRKDLSSKLGRDVKFIKL